MPAIWELQAQGTVSSPAGLKKIAVCIPHLGEVSTEWAVMLKNMSAPPGTQVFFSRGMPIDVTREQMVRDVLNAGFEYVFFLDSDVVLPDNAIATLMSHNLPLVCGLYDAKKREGFYPAMWVRTKIGEKGKEKETFGAVAQWQGRMVRVDVTGCGCMLVHRSVFEKIREKTDLPFFYWTKERTPALVEKMNLPDTLMKELSEDFFFCLLAKHFANIDTIIDTEVRCGHITTTKLIKGKVDLPGV